MHTSVTAAGGIGCEYLLSLVRNEIIRSKSFKTRNDTNILLFRQVGIPKATAKKVRVER